MLYFQVKKKKQTISEVPTDNVNVFELDYTSIGEFRTSLKGIETPYDISTKFLVCEAGFIILQMLLVLSCVVCKARL